MTTLRTVAEIERAGRDSGAGDPPLTVEQVARLRVLVNPAHAVPERRTA